MFQSKARIEESIKRVAKKKYKEEISSTRGFFDNFIEKKMAQKLNLPSEDTGSNQNQG